jgi:hypothetical protein
LLLILAVLAVGAVLVLKDTGRVDSGDRAQINAARLRLAVVGKESPPSPAVSAKKDDDASVKVTEAAPSNHKYKVVVESTPTGAKVMFNGLVLGTTPWRKNVAAADPELELLLLLDGYRDKAVRFQPGVLHSARIPEMRVELVKRPPVKRKRVRRPAPRKAAGRDDPFGGID